MALGLWVCMVVAQGAPAQVLVPPVPTASVEVTVPAGAPELFEPVVVKARVFVGVDGAVFRVELVDKNDGVFGEAVLVAATQFTFRPATQDGVPTAAGIIFSETFLPRPAAVAVPEGVLHGEIWERGTHRPLAGAQVRAVSDKAESQTVTDAAGTYRMSLPLGLNRLEVSRPGYKAFRVTENITSGEALQVRYLVEREFYTDYETVVVSKRGRSEISRVSLSGAEINQVPGTFGDPFRAVTALPGVGAVFSLVGYPIVRGTSPGTTGFLLDGVPIPQLFHLLFGPSVIHPEFIDRVDFYPGMFPANYGGYIGGIIDGVTRRAGAADSRVDTDINLLQAGVFVRGSPTSNTSGAAAARYGFPGLLLSAFNAPFRLTYWDYQARLDGRLGGGRYKVFTFGALDKLTNFQPGNVESVYGTQFHRVETGWSQEGSFFSQGYLLVMGVDETLAGGTLSDLRSYSVLPKARWQLKFSERANLQLGVDIGLQWYQGFTQLEANSVWSHLDSTGAFASLVAQPIPALLLTLSGRTDRYDNGTVSQTGVDPRFSFRLRLGKSDGGDWWFKGGVGRYHQPPRWVVPLPGLDNIGLQQGLLSSYQSSLGIEVPVATGLELDIQGYFNYMDRLVFDLSVNYDPLAPIQTSAPDTSTGTAVPNVFGALADIQVGRSFGLEAILRKHESGSFFGWLSYTLSRSERLRAAGWRAYDFDRTHMVQAVGGFRMPRNWQLGSRLQFTSGRPETANNGPYNAQRSPSFYRLDMRIDKRAVFNDWLLDFYVDIINVTNAPEFLDQTNQSLHYVLPTLGLRAVL